MSSPKRAAKAVERTVVKRAGKTRARGRAAAKSFATKPSAAKRSNSPSLTLPRLRGREGWGSNGASADAKRLAATLERSIADGKLDLLSADALQVLIAAACRVYSARTEAGEQFTPVPKHSISATDVMLTASGLLRAADLAVFELGMWQSWTGR